MVEIKDLLSRFDNILLFGGREKEFIRKIISETIGVEIKTKDIEIKDGTVYLKVKPIYKNEIFLKKEKIFLKLKEFLKKKTPQGIR